MAGEIRYTTNHEVIRRWVEARGGWPAKYLRIHFHGFVTRGAPPRVDWEKFFRAFEERRLAFLYQDQTATGKQSHFFRLVNRRVEPVIAAPPSAVIATDLAADPYPSRAKAACSAAETAEKKIEEIRGEVALTGE